MTTQRFIATSLTLLLVSTAAIEILDAHCEVPCGIYGDSRRFEEMLEDQTTIAKSIVQIETLSKDNNVVSMNQSVRWVNTKETHATNIQNVIAQYFMTQRIKPGSENYIKKLTAAHAVMVASMKCKQNVDTKTAETLKKSILDFYRVYEGKEPHFHGK